MKIKTIKLILWLLTKLRLRKFFIKAPSTFISVEDWCHANKNLNGIRLIHIAERFSRQEEPPIIVGMQHVSKRFTKYYQREIPGSFVATIPGGKVLGQDCNIIISPDNKVLSDVSREFGAEGGKKPATFSVFTRLRMPELKRLSGNIAIVSTMGSANFHHWNYDVLPRFHLLRQAGVFDEIDFFLVNHQEQPFQLEGLKKLGIIGSRIINTAGASNFYIQADKLYVPSLTEELGTISPWVVDFLRETFLDKKNQLEHTNKKLFLSRKQALTRKFINDDEVMHELRSRGFVEFFPENYSMSDTAVHFSNAKAVVSVHGSGLSNLAFLEEGAAVLDIMSPYHQDGYYWMISNLRHANFVGLFSEGGHPPDDYDLIQTKVDEDLLVDIEKFKKALDHIS